LKSSKRFVPVIFLFLLLSFLFLSPTYAKPYTVIKGTVIEVHDGDTVIIRPDKVGEKKITCRLYGIDAPEVPHNGKRGQPYGREAQRELRNLIDGYRVTVTLTGDKTYKREVCIIEKAGIDINLEMVKRGFAWAYRQYLKRPHASEYIGAENEARGKKRGLWVQRNPQPPWEYRHRNKR
jgi:micrococcal nuclease